MTTSLRSERSRVPARIEGDVEPGFEALAATFEENFRSRGEVGASLCLYLDGRAVVDLWGGHRDAAKQLAWEHGTLSCIMSTTKCLSALSVLLLVDREEIELDDPVTEYWPAFGCEGKHRITIRQLLGGHAALVYADEAPAGSAFNHEVLAAALAKQPPAWPPGSRGAYHSTTMGTLLAEVVRRVDGRAIDQFIADEIAAPLGIELFLGLSRAGGAPVSEIIPNPNSDTLRLVRDPATKLARAWRIMPQVDGVLFNAPVWREGVFPSGNGFATARGIARLFAALGSGVGGRRLLSSELIEEIRQAQWEGLCGLTDRPYRYGLGFFLNCPPLVPLGPNPRAFGHPGLGGVLGFADPEAGLAFAYLPNFLCADAGVGERCESLVNAAYAGLT